MNEKELEEKRNELCKQWVTADVPDKPPYVTWLETLVVEAKETISQITLIADKQKYELETELLKAREEIERLKAVNGELIKLLEVSKCPLCDGSGAIPVKMADRQVVTRDMALDAECPEMEGSLYRDEEWGAEQCQFCDERKQLLTRLTGGEKEGGK